MTKPKLAIVGSGIAGLGCAHFLNNEFDITVFEKRKRIGGHVNSVSVSEYGSEIAIDTGFMVYNHSTYPNFTRLIKELSVKAKPTDMSFSVQHNPCQIEWSGTGFKRLFARRSNLFSQMFWNLLFAIDKFNKKAREFLEADKLENITIAQFVESVGVKGIALDLYILPMMSSLWSAPPSQMREFPVTLFLKFMHSHGLLSIYDKLDWYTIDGGANNYVSQLIKPFQEKIEVDSGVEYVEADSQGVTIVLESGKKLQFDKCIMASHANQSRQMLSDKHEKEKQVLSNFSYQKNIATLHTDESIMPEVKGNWASWNYKILDERGSMRSSTHYWMNSLQGVSQNQDYFVTIDEPDKLDQKKILKQINYEHPVFSVNSVNAQSKVRDLNKDSKDRRIFFCGSYFKFGFHEDAFASSVDLSSHLLGRPAWS